MIADSCPCYVCRIANPERDETCRRTTSPVANAIEHRRSNGGLAGTLEDPNTTEEKASQ